MRWLVVILVLLIAGCGLNDTNGDDDNDGGDVEYVDVTLYFADHELVMSGQSGDYGFVTPVRRTVEKTPDLPLLVVNELARGPQDENGVDRTVPEVGVVSVRIDNGVCVVDFARDFYDNYSGGTTGGALFAQSLVFTLTELSQVESVLVTVDGQPWSDGHVTWDEPISRDDM